MARHAIKSATPRVDVTVAIEWADGSASKVDFRQVIARGGVLASLAEPAVFLHRLFVQSAGESLAWETAGGPGRFSRRRALGANARQAGRG